MWRDSVFGVRCDGLSQGSSQGPDTLRRILKEVSSLPPQNRVTLLDISVKNLTKIPGKVFMNLNQSLLGLVISTGKLAHVDKKVCQESLV